MSSARAAAAVMTGSFTLAIAVTPNYSSAADQIMFDAFSGGQTTESFEGFVAGENLEVSSAGAGFLIPGTVSVFEFGSGVSLTAPIPNMQLFNGVAIGDFARDSGATWFLGANGSVLSAADVPFGSAYLGHNIVSGTFELTFDTPQTRVGAFVTADASEDIIMEAFDEMGMSLGTAMVAGVDVADWGTNFLGLEDEVGIARITISGAFPIIDNLVFEVGGDPPIATCPGDADANGVVNFADITSVLQHWLDVCDQQP